MKTNICRNKYKTFPSLTFLTTSWLSTCFFKLIIKNRYLIVFISTTYITSQVLQKEYIKWKGSLLYKFLFSACSSDLGVRKLTRSCLQEILTGENRAGNCFYSNFVSAIFYFNNYEVERTCGIVKTEKFEVFMFLALNTLFWLYEYNYYFFFKAIFSKEFLNMNLIIMK